MVLISSSFFSEIFSKYVCMCDSVSVFPDVGDAAGSLATVGLKLKTTPCLVFVLFTVSFELTNKFIIIIIIIYFIQMFVLLF